MKKTALYYVAALGLTLAACGGKEETKDTEKVGSLPTFSELSIEELDKKLNEILNE